MFSFFNQGYRDEDIRAFLSNRHLFYRNFVIPGFDMPKDEQALRERVKAALNPLMPELNASGVSLPRSTTREVKRIIKSFQAEFERINNFDEKISIFEKLISDLCHCLLKRKSLRGNGFVTAVILAITTLTGEKKKLDVLIPDQKNDETDETKVKKTLDEIAIFRPHLAWSGKELEDYPDNVNNRDVYVDWLRAKIYLNDERYKLPDKTEIDDEVKQAIHELFEKIATFKGKTDPSIRNMMNCIQQNGGLFSPASQLMAFANAWVNLLNVNYIGRNSEQQFHSYRVKNASTAFKFEQFSWGTGSWGLQCRVEICLDLADVADKESGIAIAPVAFVGEFELAQNCKCASNVVFKCYGIEEDREGFECVFSRFNPKEIKDVLDVLEKNDEDHSELANSPDKLRKLGEEKLLEIWNEIFKKRINSLSEIQVSEHQQCRR